MTFRKIIRGLIKVPATPPVVAFCVFIYLLFTLVSFFEWVYEASDRTKDTTRSIRQDAIHDLRHWFTTV